jgi:hypothetical protein
MILTLPRFVSLLARLEFRARTFAGRAVLRHLGGDNHANFLGADVDATRATTGEGRQAADVRDGGGARAPHEHVELLGVVVARHGRGPRRPGRGRALVEVGLPRRRPPRRVHRVQLGGAEARGARAGRRRGRRAVDHGEEVGVVEVGAPRAVLPRRAHRVYLRARQVGRPRRRHQQRPPRRRRPAHRHVEPAVLRHLGLRLGAPALQRHHVRVHVQRRDGRRGVRELVRDERPRGAELEEEQQQRVPDDALEHHHLHHQGPGVGTVHGDQQRDAHHQRVGQRRHGEERDGPVQPRRRQPGGQARARGQPREDDQLLQRVRGQEPEVHGVRVVGGDEVEGQQRHGEDGHEAVDAGALVRREDAPPPHRPVRQEHGHVQGHHRGQHRVYIVPRYHLGLGPPPPAAKRPTEEEPREQGQGSRDSGLASSSGVEGEV